MKSGMQDCNSLVDWSSGKNVGK